MRTHIAVGVVTLFLLGVARAQPTPAAPGDYAVDEPLKVGGYWRWDYALVDDDGRLYVTRETHQQVIDLATGKVMADHQRLRAAARHGARSLRQAGPSSPTAKRRSCWSSTSRSTKSIGKIDSGYDADEAIYDAGSDRVLVSCGDANQLVVVDPNADLATAKPEKIDLGGKPEFLAADGKGRAFVCLEDKDQVAVVDLKAMRVVDRWTLGGGTSPAGLAIDAKAGRLFVGCHNQKLVVLNTDGGEVEAELPIGKGNDAVAFDPATGLTFASCGDGTLTVVGAGRRRQDRGEADGPDQALLADDGPGPGDARALPAVGGHAKGRGPAFIRASSPARSPSSSSSRPRAGEAVHVASHVA